LEFDMDRFYAGYLADLPPGTALPNDAGNAQQPDMAGGQVVLAWTLYQQYGDLATLRANYPLMTSFVDADTAAASTHIWPDNRGFGDWCPPDRGSDANEGQGGPGAGSCTSEVSLVNTALLYLQASDVAKAARALGRSADATRYTTLAADISSAFNSHFMNAAGNGYGDGRQTSSILPLAFGMVPDARIQAVGAKLVDTIQNHDGGHLDTGIFGTRYLLDALARIDRLDVAMTTLDQRTYPGFGYEISRGATTTWEEWLYSSSMETHDHAMFAGINASLYTQLAGIQPASAGYATVTVAPRIPPSLTTVSGSLNTVRGTISSHWTRSSTGFVLDVSIPSGVSATVVIPALPGLTSAPFIHPITSGNWRLIVGTV
jgi:alpha-L-rhamnosidase